VVFATEPYPEPLETITGGPAYDLQVGFISILSSRLDADLLAPVTQHTDFARTKVLTTENVHNNHQHMHTFSWKSVHVLVIIVNIENMHGEKVKMLSIFNIYLTRSVSRAIRKKLTVVKLLTTFTDFMEQQFSLQYTQKPATCP